MKIKLELTPAQIFAVLQVLTANKRDGASGPFGDGEQITQKKAFAAAVAAVAAAEAMTFE